jgi:hypothetical protein
LSSFWGPPHDELFQKFNLLLNENNRLTKENSRLKALLGLGEPELTQPTDSANSTETDIPDDESACRNCFAGVNGTSDPLVKIRLFMSLFRGRDDVYAKRWENKDKGTSGYSPVCLYQWQPGVCGKPKIPCSKCKNKLYAPLDEDVIENHLKGGIVAGIYPMLPDQTCHFLAMDFDEAGWQKDISVVRKVCTAFNVPFAVERSRSGKGGHVWFFFKNRLSAALARKFGTALLTYSMGLRHEIRFKSYDRLFPSQDTMPKGGLGNLIALPLQKAARINGNSEFIDEYFNPYCDQWAFLSTIQKIPEARLEELISKLCPGHDLGTLKADPEEETEKPWERKTTKTELQKYDFPERIDIIRANMLYIPKAGISQRALNRLKRLASFKNPMFYRQQAMRLPTHAHPRVISCADETKAFLCLPRGCEPELSQELEVHGLDIRFIDKTYSGKRIDVGFKGHLREEQSVALQHLQRSNIGILSATTAFGKTIVAIKLIAEKKVNTLILVDKVSLLSQWKEKLAEFLVVKEPLPEPPSIAIKKRGRKKKTSVIGQLGAGRNTLSGIVDIAVMQSLSRQGEVKECIKHYGMIIADECHHASAFTYEQMNKF